MRRLASNMTLPKKNRMTKQDFLKRFKTGKRIRGRFCSLQYGPIEVPESKIAIVVRSKAVSSAMERNRIRRVLSEQIGTLLRSISRPVFIIVIVHTKMNADDLNHCRQELTELLRKSGIIGS